MLPVSDRLLLPEMEKTGANFCLQSSQTGLGAVLQQSGDFSLQPFCAISSV